MRTPDGVVWRVRRRWVTRGLRRSWKERFATARDLGSAADANPFSAFDGGDLAAGLVVLVLAVAAILVVVPLLLFGLELIVVGWALATGLIGRLVLGRPWVVEASIPATPGHSLRWAASGWGGSRRLMNEVSAALAAGRALPPGELPEA